MLSPKSSFETVRSPSCPPSLVPPSLATLREGTRAAHARIENVPALACLLSDTLTPPAYVAALQVLHGFHAAMCASLPPLLRCAPLAALAQAAETARPIAGLRALADDLAVFGVSPMAALPVPAAIADWLSALGALYVVEGTGLGARIIGRAVAGSIRVTADEGGSYFCGETADHARLRWQAFCQLLAVAAPVTDNTGVTRLVAGANAAFGMIESALAGVPKFDAPGFADMRPEHSPVGRAVFQPTPFLPATVQL